MTHNKKTFSTLETYVDRNKKVQQSILVNLSKINKDYSAHKNFMRYKKEIQKCFVLYPVQIKKNAQFYCAGFIAGEGSINVSIKKKIYGPFKLMVDPEFSITQHVNGILYLYYALCIFQTGRIRYKTGSNATFVYSIDNRRHLEEKIVPFYENFIKPYGSAFIKDRIQKFKKILLYLKKKAHLNEHQMLYEILPLWDQLRMQQGQINQTFQNLEEAQHYVALSLLNEGKYKHS